MSSGLPFSATSLATMQAGSGIDLVNPSLFNTKDGHVTWENGASEGWYWGNKYRYTTAAGSNPTIVTMDPQCDPANGFVAASLQSLCTQGLRAIVLAEDTSKVVFQHAVPGVKGNLNPNSLTGPGRWSVDMAVSKDITIKEGKSINFRMDINNIFNHATPSGTAPSSYDQRTYAAGSPLADINNYYYGDYLGKIPYKVGHRVFSAKLRFTF
jgi:hypothetical protein